MPAVFSSRPYTFDRFVRILAGIALLAGAVWLINKLRNVLLPFCLACLIAYMLEPVVEFNMKHLRIKRRVWASLLTLLEVTAVISLLVYFFLPSVLDEIRELESFFSDGVEKGDGVPFVPDNIVDYVRTRLSTINIRELVTDSRFRSLLDSGSTVVSATFDAVFHTLEWLLAFIYVIFIMIDYPSLMRSFRLLVPTKYRKIAYRISDDIKYSMNRYFRGQALLALCAAVLYCVGFSIVGIPLAIVLGITVGVLYMIPYFQYVTLVPVAAVCLLNSMGGHASFWPEFGQCLLVYVVSQCVCDYVLTPKVMGKAMGLNPAVILLSLSVWGTLLGLIGMIIALPLTTLLLAYYQEFVVRDSSVNLSGLIKR